LPITRGKEFVGCGERKPTASIAEFSGIKMCNCHRTAGIESSKFGWHRKEMRFSGHRILHDCLKRDAVSFGHRIYMTFNFERL